MKIKKILITGSYGYIGKCLFSYLKNKNYNVYGIDKAYRRNSDFEFKVNLNNKKILNKILSKIKPQIIIHLAGQSTIDGIYSKEKYELNNIRATKILIQSMRKYSIRNIIFSSTASVYKNNNKSISENSEIFPSNVYSHTKLKSENLIKNSKDINYVIFRFFNVCSSIPKLNVGEFHSPETHLIPITVNKIIKEKKIRVYGNNFKTKDGTCIRDYIHIEDLCIAFEKTIKSFFNKNIINNVFNLGSGKSFTILEVIKNACKIILPIKKNKDFLFVKRRKGDLDKLLCNYKKAKKFLGWIPVNSYLKKIIEDEFIWQKKNLNKRRLFIY